MFGHGAIGGFIRLIRFIKALRFRICLKLLNDSVNVLWIIFGNKGFNARRIKDGHVGLCRVNSHADGFGNINKVLEYELQIICLKRVILEASGTLLKPQNSRSGFG